jgi:flavodoxin
MKAMKKLFAILFALILCVNALPVLAVDAVSSATVDIAAFPELTEHEDAKTLVIYFSTDDTVKAVALTAADVLKADVFEIVPEQPYTEEDLAYYTNGRCDQEQADASARPGIAVWPEPLEQYDVVFIGYPIWHGQAPKILYTLLEGIDLSGKTVVPFCTSISSGAGSSATNLAKLTGNTTTWLKVERIANHATDEQIRAWALSALEDATK